MTALHAGHTNYSVSGPNSMVEYYLLDYIQGVLLVSEEIGA